MVLDNLLGRPGLGWAQMGLTSASTKSIPVSTVFFGNFSGSPCFGRVGGTSTGLRCVKLSKWGDEMTWNFGRLSPITFIVLTWWNKVSDIPEGMPLLPFFRFSTWIQVQLEPKKRGHISALKLLMHRCIFGFPKDFHKAQPIWSAASFLPHFWRASTARLPL
jgi:hypothetical protein